MIRSSDKEKKHQISTVNNLLDINKKESKEMMKKIRNCAVNNKNLFEILMEATKFCSLGQITNQLFEVGGQYRRNM